MSQISSALEPQIIATASLDLSDHVVFDIASLKVSTILEGAAQDGVRFELTAHVGSAHAKLALDITSGNAIHPDPVWLEFPSLLGLETSAILGYALETIFSEKLAAAVELGTVTTRLKDFYDLHQIVTRAALSLPDVRLAVGQTFAQRGLELVGSAELLGRLGFDQRLSQRWQAFLGESNLVANTDFAATLEPIIALVNALESAGV